MNIASDYRDRRGAVHVLRAPPSGSRRSEQESRRSAIGAFPARPAEFVEAVYAFAARNSEVLHYMPCFCGCQSRGHRDNDECFITGRDANGRPKWEPHGAVCAICIDVARDAMQMHASGAAVSQIRSAIEAKYRPSFSSMTPTSPPPMGK